MIRVWTHYISIVALLVFSSGGIITTAYFSDIEAAPGSNLAAGTLDGLLDGVPFSGAVCGVGDTRSTELSFENVGSVPFDYGIAVDEVAGSLCAVLSLAVFVDDVKRFDGDLADLDVDSTTLAVGEGNEIRLRASIPDGASVSGGELCVFDTVFTAAQESFVHGTAFYDTERVTHTIQAETPEPAGDVIIENDNHATVTNETNATASTGGNTAGSGGTVITGDASAHATTANRVNENRTDIDSCGCACNDECDKTDADQNDTDSTSNTNRPRTDRNSSTSPPRRDRG